MNELKHYWPWFLSISPSFLPSPFPCYTSIFSINLEYTHSNASFVFPSFHEATCLAAATAGNFNFKSVLRPCIYYHSRNYIIIDCFCCLCMALWPRNLMLLRFQCAFGCDDMISVVVFTLYGTVHDDHTPSSLTGL